MFGIQGKNGTWAAFNLTKRLYQFDVSVYLAELENPYVKEFVSKLKLSFHEDFSSFQNVLMVTSNNSENSFGDPIQAVNLHYSAVGVPESEYVLKYISFGDDDTIRMAFHDKARMTGMDIFMSSDGLLMLLKIYTETESGGLYTAIYRNYDLPVKAHYITDFLHEFIVNLRESHSKENIEKFKKD